MIDHRNVIVVDMDGTLADCRHRIHHALAKDWPSFHALSRDDPPHDDLVTAVKAFISNWPIVDVQLIICTGRSEQYRKITHDWLMAHGIAYDTMLMRPDEDYSPDGELKVGLLSRFFGSIEEARRRVLFILDDRDSAIEGLRNAGLPVWQVRPSGY